MQPEKRKSVRCKQIQNVLAPLVQCWKHLMSIFFLTLLFEMVITVAVPVVNSVLGLEQQLAGTHLASSENNRTGNILIHLYK